MGNQIHNTFYTPLGLINVEHLAHGSIHIDWEGMHIYVDPYSDLYNYSKMKKADLIILTHAHTDHYDGKAIKEIATPNTEFIISKGVETCVNHDLTKMGIDVDNNELNVDPSTNLENVFRDAHSLKNCTLHTLYNNDTIKIKGIEIKAIPAYNINNKRDNGHPFHIKGQGNGYILNMGGFKIYIAGDTEFIPEMEEAKGADIAFLPKNLPYTLSDEEFIKAANFIKPKNLYPIHYFEINPKVLLDGLSTGICLYVNGTQCHK
ncbi:MAG: MBL fold metallo-hydrolase [Bacteroidales bacterium]|nr:MBL fold metallo-hydrolase [Bacteroidales bacterium]